MNCPQCKNLMVKAKATAFGEEYDYCRTCKKELKEIKVKKPSPGVTGRITVSNPWNELTHHDIRSMFSENDLVTTPRYSNLVFQVVKIYPSFSNSYILECICNGNIYMLHSSECTNVGKMATIKP